MDAKRRVDTLLGNIGLYVQGVINTLNLLYDAVDDDALTEDEIDYITHRINAMTRILSQGLTDAGRHYTDDAYGYTE